MEIETEIEIGYRIQNAKCKMQNTGDRIQNAVGAVREPPRKIVIGIKFESRSLGGRKTETEIEIGYRMQ